MPVIKAIDHFFTRLTRVPYSAYLFIIPPVIIAGGRALLEEVLLGLRPRPVHNIMNMIIWYVLLQLLLTAALRLGTGREAKQMAGAAAVAMLMAWLPPIMDVFNIFAPQADYKYFTEFHWNFAAPYLMIGETISIWLALAGMAAFSAWATRKVSRVLLSLLLIYLVIQFMGYAFMYLTRAALAAVSFISQNRLGPSEEIFQQITGTKAMNLVGIIIIGAVYAALNHETMFRSLKKIAHALPWGLAAAVGSRMLGESVYLTLVKAAVMTTAFLAIIVANDYFDREEDAAGGGEARPVTRDDMIFASFIMAMLSFWLLTVFDKGFYLLLMFFALGVAYNIPALRFKRLFCMNYAVEGCATVICFLFGTTSLNLFFPYQGLGPPKQAWVLICSFLALGGFALGSMFKDYKDIEQDRAAGVGTVYTRYMAKGHSLKNIHRFVTVSNVLMLLVPPLWLIAIKQPFWVVIGLASLAMLHGALLYFPKNNGTAVKFALLAFDLYLLALAILAPAMGGKS